MSLNYNYTKCQPPQNDKERSDIDALIWATMAIKMGSITEKNVCAFYARLAFLEKAHGPMRFRIGENGKPEPLYFEFADVKRWIGLYTNVQTEPEAKFLASFRFDLRDFEEDAARQEQKQEQAQELDQE